MPSIPRTHLHKERRSGSIADSAPWLRRHRNGVAIFVVGALATLAIFLWLRARDHDHRRLEFERVAAEVTESVSTEFQIPLEALLSAAAFFEASDDVTRDDFAHFTGGALQRYPSVYSFEWFPLVAGQDRERFQAEIRAEGFEQFEIQEKTKDGTSLVPARVRSEYMPLLYMQPIDARVLGLDVIADAPGANAPRSARASGQLVAAPAFRLVEDIGGGLAVVAYHPVQDLEPGGGFRGLVAVILRVKPAMERALSHFGHHLVVRLTDEGQPLYASHDAQDIAAAPTSLSWSRSLDFANRHWQLELRPAPGSPWSGGMSPWIVLMAGLLVSGLGGWGLSSVATILRLRHQVDAALQLGQYNLGRKLGEGGMGVVYEAEHRLLARPAAIKLIRPDALGTHDPGRTHAILTRFESEARSTAQLQSPHTISVYDFGRTDAGEFYYVMEMLTGLNLDEMVERFGPQPPNRTCYLVEQVCDSLAEAHDRGLIHRDIKPANVYACHYGLQYDFAKVLDFGLVKSIDDRGEAGSGVTVQGALVGTPGFMSPELAMSESNIDGRSDLYSLGCVAYWLLTGALVFNEETAMATASCHVTKAPPPPSSRANQPIPESLEAIILSCLEKDPADRPQTAQELKEQLRACAAALPPWDPQEWWEQRLAELSKPATAEPAVRSGVRP